MNIPINNNIYTTINNNIRRIPTEGKRKNYHYYLNEILVGDYLDICELEDYYENKVD